MRRVNADITPVMPTALAFGVNTGAYACLYFVTSY
jgi:hypothetical protein